MDAQHIRSVVESFYGDIWNRHDKQRIPDLLAPGVTFRGSLGQSRTGHEGLAAYVDGVHAALADYQCDVRTLVVEPPHAFARVHFSGRHHGEIFGYAPTGEIVEWDGCALFTFDGPLIADLWVLGDVYGLLDLLERQAHAQRR